MSRHFITHDNLQDENLKRRDEYGKYSETGRETVTIRMPRYFHKYIRSLLLEQLLKMGLYEVWKSVEIDGEVDVDVMLVMLSEKFTKDDIRKMERFFKTDIWNIIVGEIENDEQLT